MENKKLSVEAIENGTVIDHIPAGLGLAILRQFKLLHYGSAVTVGFNLPSKTQGRKDIIKISGVAFDDEAANRLALFADEIAEVFRCPNANCASHGEPVKSRFSIRGQGSQTKLKCHYCEKTFPREFVLDA